MFVSTGFHGLSFLKRQYWKLLSYDVCGNSESKSDEVVLTTRSRIDATRSRIWYTLHHRSRIDVIMKSYQVVSSRMPVSTGFYGLSIYKGNGNYLTDITIAH